jgi:hypothetical protein
MLLSHMESFHEEIAGRLRIEMMREDLETCPNSYLRVREDGIFRIIEQKAMQLGSNQGHGPEVPPEKESHPFKCPIQMCPNSFVDTLRLLKHMDDRHMRFTRDTSMPIETMRQDLINHLHLHGPDPELRKKEIRYYEDMKNKVAEYRIRTGDSSRSRSPPHRPDQGHESADTRPSDVPPADELPPFQCPILMCTTAFVNVLHLLTHMESNHQNFIMTTRMPLAYVRQLLYKCETPDLRKKEEEIDQMIKNKAAEYHMRMSECGPEVEQIPPGSSAAETQPMDVTRQPAPSDPRIRPSVEPDAPPLQSPSEETSDFIIRTTSEEFIEERCELSYETVLGNEQDIHDHNNYVMKQKAAAKGGPGFSTKVSGLPPVPGVCPHCNELMFDLITHCLGFHGQKMDREIAINDHLFTGSLFPTV